MTDPAEFSRQEKEKEGTEETKEQHASRKLEENLKESSGDKPENPEEAKKQQGEEDPY